MNDVAPSKGQIRISRDSERDIKMRSLEVFVDGEFVDDLHFGAAYSSDIDPGTHTFKATNRLFTKQITVDVRPGDDIHLQVCNYFGGLGGIMVAVFGFGHYNVSIKQMTN